MTEDLFDLTDKVCVVTGGSRGLGREMVLAFAERGADVVIASRKLENCEAVAEEVRALGRRALPVAYHAASWDGADELAAAAYAEFGRVDVLVNNAGYNRNAPIFTMKLEDYDAVAGLARGTWYLTKLVLRRFMLRSGGRIVNVSSVVGHTGNAGQIPYTMAKAGLDAFTRSLAQEVQGRDVLVNSVAPGFIDTEMTGVLPDDVRARILERIPLGRMGRPEEVAEVVTFLATSASYVTGSVIHVNGGMYGG